MPPAGIKDLPMPEMGGSSQRAFFLEPVGKERDLWPRQKPQPAQHTRPQ